MVLVQIFLTYTQIFLTYIIVQADSGHLELLVSLWTPTGLGKTGMERMLRLVSLRPRTSTYMCWPELSPHSTGSGSLARTMN